MGGFFYGLVMVLVVGWSLIQACPVIAADAALATTRRSEGLFGSHTGAQKKESAISFVAAALQLTESVANREIVDENKFKDGLGKNNRWNRPVLELVQLGTGEVTGPSFLSLTSSGVEYVIWV